MKNGIVEAIDTTNSRLRAKAQDAELELNQEPEEQGWYMETKEIEQSDTKFPLIWEGTCSAGTT
jgi:hypothetical protein